MLLIVLLLLLHLCSNIQAQLRVGFYQDTCPNAESIIREEVKKAFFGDKGIAPGIVRMHFHDCFVRKRTAHQISILYGGFQVIDSAKARLERECRGIVSCSDILAYAARDSVVITGGLGWDVPAGRRDGRISRSGETLEIPAPFDNLDKITQSFASKNLSQDDMIALVGAHTIGRSRCTSFSDRLYDFNSTNMQDPTLDPSYASLLKSQCAKRPQGSVNPNSVVSMNPSSSLFENSYYAGVLMNKGLFTSDQTLTTSQDSLDEVKEYAMSNKKWLQDFAEAMSRMSQIQVLTGTIGEIRLNCRVVNW